MRNLYGYLVWGIFALILASQVPAQELSREQKSNVVNRISSMLEERYVFPETALKCSEHIKKQLESGTFDSITTKESFAAALTAELQSISKDKHMRVRAEKRTAPQEIQDPFYEEFLSRQQNKESNVGFARVEFLDGGIGYLDLRFFAPLEISRKYAESAMNLLANSDALIIDLRKNSGGSPDLISFISSYFFDLPTHLNSLYWREGNRTEEFWTKKIEGSTLTDVPIFVLTSSSTFSGGEEFANNLKTQKRATIIGETTGGGANPGGLLRIDNDFGIFIPTGRAINPVTNSNWEGTGVEPDIKVSKEEAYDIALQKALTAAGEYRKKKSDEMLAVSKKISGELDEAEAMLVIDKPKAEETIGTVFNEGIAAGLIDENAINNAGYSYLEKEKYDMAIAIFKFNVGKYPGSFNTYDSLGEAYMKSGQKELAVTNYRKSLDLNPDNKNAEEMIDRIKGEN